MRAILPAFLAIPLATWAHAGANADLNAARFGSHNGAHALTSEAASTASGAVFEGGRSAPGAVQGSEGEHRPNLYAAPGLAQSGPIAPPAPQLPASAESKGKFPKWAMYAAGGGLGFLQGALFGGLFAGLAGAAVGLAASHFYVKDKPEISLGISAGSIVGSFLGGPVGGLIGAAVGGLVGWLVGKLF